MANIDWWVWVVIVFILVALVIYWFSRRREEPRDEGFVRPSASHTSEPAPALEGTPHPAVVEPAPATPPLETAVPVPAAPALEDDLQIIEGIGPKISALLKAEGITTFAQLAATPLERLDQILIHANLRRIANPGTWSEQAGLAAAGKMDELKALQARLSGGQAK